MAHDVARRRLPRDLYIAAGARAVSMLGSIFAVTALTLDLHDRGAGVWAVAGLLAAGTVPIVLAAPLVGIVVDRYDSRALIIMVGVWQAATCAVLAFVVNPLIILPIVALNGFGTALANPVIIALTRLLVPDNQLAAANSVQQGSIVVAMTMGPAVSSALTGVTGGARVPLLLDAALFLVISLAGLLIRTRRQPDRDGTPPRARDGFAFLFTDTAVAAMVLLAFLLTLVVHLIYVAQVFLVRDSFGASELAFGMLQATQTVGLLIGTALASRLNTARRILLGAPLGAAVLSTALVLIGLIPSLPAVFALYVVAGVCMSTVSVSVGTMLLLRTPEPAIGLALASFYALHRTASVIAYGLGGLVVSAFSPETVYVLSGTAALIATLVMTPSMRRARRENAPARTENPQART